MTTQSSESESQLRFDGRVAVISGAGGGLGREYTLLLARRGAKVLVNDIKIESQNGEGPKTAAKAVVNEILAAGGEALANTASVATSAGGREIIAAAFDAWGRVDIVINNAGFNNGARGRPWDEDAFGFANISDADLQEMIDVNLLSAFHLLRPAWRIMKEQHYGRIINTSSGNVFGNRGVCYTAAKAAMLGLTTNLAMEGEPWGIKVNSLMPTAWTGMAGGWPKARQDLLKNNFQAEKVAPVVAALVHENVPCSGECFAAAAGRFARVFLGETRGSCPTPFTPETVLNMFEEAVSTDGFVAPKGSTGHVQFTCEVLGLPFEG